MECNCQGGTFDHALACVSSCIAYGRNLPAAVRGSVCVDGIAWLVQGPMVQGLWGAYEVPLLLLLRTCCRFQALVHHFDPQVNWRARLDPTLLHRLRGCLRPRRVPHELSSWSRPITILLGTG